MRLVIQRVKKASVSVEEKIVGKIAAGLLVFIGVAKTDEESDAIALAEKVSALRIFEDQAGKMNLSAADVNGEFLIVSQFTLYGDCRKGRRPSFDQAADPQTGERLYLFFVDQMKRKGFEVQTGQFRAMMDVALVNDGPVTFIIDSESGTATS